MSIGELSYLENWPQLLGTSIPYQFSVRSVALAKDRSYTSIEHLYFPFDKNIWYCIGGTLLTLFIISIFVKHSKLFDDKEESQLFISLISELLQNCINYLPTTNIIRILLALWMITCIVLRSSYQGSLFEFMRNHKKMPSPRTINELRDADYRIYFRLGGLQFPSNLR